VVKSFKRFKTFQSFKNQWQSARAESFAFRQIADGLSRREHRRCDHPPLRISEQAGAKPHTIAFNAIIVADFMKIEPTCTAQDTISPRTILWPQKTGNGAVAL
jgi:hypothetical protein